MKHIFVSYSRKDSQTVDNIVEKLEQDGFNIWIDREEIKPGKLWRTQIVEAIDTCEAFVLMLSSNSAASDNVRREIDLAQDSRRSIFIFRLNDVKPPADIRYQLAGLQHIDLEMLGFSEAVNQLIETLKEQSKPALEQPVRQAELVIEGVDPAAFGPEKREQLLDFVSVLANTPSSQLQIAEVVTGSLHVFVDMPARTAFQLKTLALNRDQRFKQLGIQALRLVGDQKFVNISLGILTTTATIGFLQVLWTSIPTLFPSLLGITAGKVLAILSAIIVTATVFLTIPSLVKPATPTQIPTPSLIAMATAPAEIPTRPVASSIVPFSQITPAPVAYGPDLENFPEGINPLTGQRVTDASLLEWPALLVSISNFPASGRPQAGMSFAPYVFEIYITEGATRFLTAFYGDFPYPEVPFDGDCEVRTEPFVKTASILGNQVWLDANKNGLHDINENGVGGVCVNLHDASGALIQETTTDTNGYYGFNVQPGTYTIEFVKPAGFDITGLNRVEDDNSDNDADQATGRTEAIEVSSDDLRWDAGLIPLSNVTPPISPLPEVGPIRSSRLIYAYIGAFLRNSCLIDGGASSEIRKKVPFCSRVGDSDNGLAMLDIDRLRDIAEDNARKRGSNFNYSSNLYTDEPPVDGTPVSEVDVFWKNLNQYKWVYDALSQSWWRYTDTADEDAPGVLHFDTDRLNGRQLHFENVIVLFAKHTVISPTNLDIHLEQGITDQAFLFRDGQKYDIQWSTVSDTQEQQSGLRRPIRFQNLDGSPAALRPGHTWVIVVTPYSRLEEISPGVWKIRFIAPEGAAE